MSYPIIWLIRHSIRPESMNAATLSVTDLSITEGGAELAKHTGLHMSSFLKPNEVTQLYVSPYRRTIETALLIAAEFPLCQVSIEPKLAEAIMPFATHKSETCEISSPPYLLPYLHTHQIICPETKMETIQRSMTFIESIKTNPNKNILVVTHGAIIMLLLCELFDWYREATDNGQIALKNPYFPKYCNYVGIQYDGSRFHLIRSDFLPQ